MVEYNSIVIHYGEITLKRGKRPIYEKMLKKNLEKALGRKLRRLRGRLILNLKNGEYRELCNKIGKTFGVVWYSPAIHVKKDLKIVEEKIVEALREEDVKSFKVIVKRSDKTYPLTSIEIAEEIGREVSSKLNVKVDLKNPEKIVYVEVTENSFYILFNKIRGFGGLPVGSSGKVLSLFSGGIDSPVATWMMMKRGCSVDLLHIHPFLRHEEVLETKIEKIARLLSSYSLGLTLYLASFRPFFLRSFEIPSKMILVTFRAYILKIADKLAKKKGYLGIVTGDNLGQAASQTLENLYAVDNFSQTPVYRPLIGMDKQEIIDLAKKIGTYDLSIEDYRDCCSIIARHPETRARAEDLKELWDKLNLDEVVDQTLTDIAEYKF
ncbi:MAG: tRNA 4-thiouridine(8) synthase ThiI [Aigarchaeota archaeon]|nr:tRNA 4-thiouridine(8) synthase ThiI [Aigarchaeota archaeon]MCX8193321.1 tRNA 4-thiouridine(8) synthase ThiI [Nitrososphaeria archaeon]MDW7986540.1 tRNA uracil 4-sulfurtransferase ThiI [Nitrososphaerota archaeon]